MGVVSASPLLWPPAGELPLVITPPDKDEWGRRVALFLREQGAPWNRMVVFATSGSSGGPPKGVVFRPDALEASARGVNAWLGADKGGDWCCPLPVYHVGGFMIHVRAALAGTRVYEYEGKWNPGRFTRLLENCGAAWTSLVPAQVVDLVAAREKAPSSLRLAVVGGGALEPEVGERARELGWPVVQSYGMTESASQIATALLNEPYTGKEIPVLPHWQLKQDSDGRLSLMGAGRFSAYVRTEENGQFVLEKWEPDQWWSSRDIVSLSGDRLTFTRRADRVVKILGELVDVDDLESRFAALLPGALLCPLPDSRKGTALYACFPENSALSSAVSRWNSQSPGLHRLDGYFPLEIPRNSMGKIDRKALERLCLDRL